MSAKVSAETTAPEEWIFYHALYHLITHWAAYMATLVLLITIGLFIVSSPPVSSSLYCVFVIVVAGLASGFFLCRMNTFGNVVNRQLKLKNEAQAKLYLEGTQIKWLPNRCNLCLGAVVVVALMVLDFLVLFKII